MKKDSWTPCYFPTERHPGRFCTMKDCPVMNWWGPGWWRRLRRWWHAVTICWRRIETVHVESCWNQVAKVKPDGVTFKGVLFEWDPTLDKEQG